MTRLRSFYLTVIMVFGCLSVQASETFQVSWESVGFAASAGLHPAERVSIIGTPEAKKIPVVESTSEPASPFEGQSALFVESTQKDSFWFRLGFRALEGTEPAEIAKGAVEFFLQPEQGSIRIQAGFQNDPWIPETQETYMGGTGQFTLRLAPGEEPSITVRVMETDSIQYIESSQIYRVTIKWDFEGDEPMIRVFLNGEPLREPGAPDPFNAAVLQSTKEAGINVFRITLGSSAEKLGSFFLGPMASAVGGEDFDVESAAEPLIIP